MRPPAGVGRGPRLVVRRRRLARPFGRGARPAGGLPFPVGRQPEREARRLCAGQGGERLEEGPAVVAQEFDNDCEMTLRIRKDNMPKLIARLEKVESLRFKQDE